MAIPTVISSLVLVVYNMADTFFVGQTHDAFQVAAVSLTNPVFVMYMAIANLLGIGGSAVISILLGQNEKDKARAASSFCCYASLAFGVVLGGLIIVFMDPLLALLGATENTWQFSKDYLFYIALGAPFILFANTFGHTVRGEGAAKASMIGGMIGTVVNIVLDPIFILTFGMDTAGAAILYVYLLCVRLRVLSLLLCAQKPAAVHPPGRAARRQGDRRPRAVHRPACGRKLRADERGDRAAQ